MQTRRIPSLVAASVAVCVLHFGVAAVWAQAPAGAAPTPDAKPTPAKPAPAQQPAQPAPAQQPAQPKPAPAKPAPDAKPAPETPPDEPAGAQREPTPEEIEQAKQAFLKGRELFEKKEYEAAVKEFKEAYRLSKNPLLLYNIGFTLDAMKQKELALFYYEKFMKDAGPNAGQYAEVAARVKQLKGTIESESVFDTGSMKGPEDAAEQKEDEPETKITGFMHKVVEEAPPGVPLDLTAFIPDDSGWQVTLFFRSAQESKFTSTAMRPRYNELVGRIPASKTTDASLQYYIEVRDGSGTIVARSGRSTSPHLVLIDENAKPQYYPDVGAETVAGAGAAGDPAGVSAEGGAVVPAGSGGLGDVQSRPFQIAKWGTTAAAAGFLAGAITFYVSASQYSSGLEQEAAFSTSGDVCAAGPPCRSYSDFQKNIDATGRRFETMGHVTLGIGVAAAGAAGYFWVRELLGRRGAAEASAAAPAPAVSAVPVIGGDFVGGAAAVRF